MQINCLIIDDEELAIKVIESYIRKVPYLRLEASSTSPFEAMEILKNKKIDLVFLDIEMPDLTGMELIRSLKDQPSFIFVTAYREFAADAFDLDSVDYLVKPVSFSRFLKAVNKFRIFYHSNHPLEEQFLNLKADRKVYKVEIKSILYLEGLKDYVKVFLESGEMIIVKETMTSFDHKLQPFSFIRCHKSYIISVSHVKAFSSEFIEISDRYIPIGRNYRDEVMLLLNAG